MDIHARLAELVLEAKSPSDALASAASAVAEAVGAQACMVFVRRTKNGVELGADHGPSRDRATSSAAKMLAEKTLGDVLPQRGEAGWAGMVAVPVAAINHAIGAIVVQ